MAFLYGILCGLLVICMISSRQAAKAHKGGALFVFMCLSVVVCIALWFMTWHINSWAG